MLARLSEAIMVPPGLGDVYNPVDPATLLTRLQTVGFGAVTLSVDHGLTLRARKPDPEGDGIWEHDS